MGNLIVFKSTLRDEMAHAYSQCQQHTNDTTQSERRQAGGGGVDKKDAEYADRFLSLPLLLSSSV